MNVVNVVCHNAEKVPLEHLMHNRGIRSLCAGPLGQHKRNGREAGKERGRASVHAASCNVAN